MEAEFAFNQARSARFRNIMGGCAAACLVALDVGVVFGAWSTGVFVHDPKVFASLLTFLVSCTIFCTSYAFSYRIPVVRQYLEYTSYFIASSAVVLFSILTVWWKYELYSEENYLRFAPILSEVFGLAFDPANPRPRKDSIVYHIVVLYHELLFSILLQSCILIVYVLFDVLTPTRFFIASRLQITNTLVGLIPYIYGAFQLPETLLPK